jgi:hypothetical protein
VTGSDARSITITSDDLWENISGNSDILQTFTKNN